MKYFAIVVSAAMAAPAAPALEWTAVVPAGGTITAIWLFAATAVRIESKDGGYTATSESAMASS